MILVDSVGRVAEEIALAQRTCAIARQRIVVGLGLSGIAMIFAGFGLIPPVTGALLQEGVDIAVILNAMRTLSGRNTEAQIQLRACRSSHDTATRPSVLSEPVHF